MVRGLLQVALLGGGVCLAACGRPVGPGSVELADRARPDFTGQYDDGGNHAALIRHCPVGTSGDDCSVVPFSEAGEPRARAFDRAAYQEAYASSCTVAHMPEVTSPGRYLLGVRQTDQLVTLYHQRTDTARAIVMTEDPPPENLPSTRLGYSVGRWEQDALIVETTHLVGGTIGNSGLPYSDQTVITERYWRAAGRDDHLNYEVTLEDPVNYTEPFLLSRYELVAQPDYEWLPWNCSIL